MSNDKTAEEIHDRYCAGVPYQLGLREASINAMKAYSAQQLKEYKDVIRELLPLAEAGLKDFLPESRGEVKAEAIIERASKLIDQTDSAK